MIFALSHGDFYLGKFCNALSLHSFCIRWPPQENSSCWRIWFLARANLLQGKSSARSSCAKTSWGDVVAQGTVLWSQSICLNSYGLPIDFCFIFVACHGVNDNAFLLLHIVLTSFITDPSLIQPTGNLYQGDSLILPPSTDYGPQSFDISSASPSPRPLYNDQFAQGYSTHLHPGVSSHIFHNGYSHSPYLTRRGSVTSMNSKRSYESPVNVAMEVDSDSQEKGRCPHPDCGRVFKDLKAHMLTHQSERPEKCPILNCEYNQKGFARKYDKNRHTLTHFRGTMVCDFCPGSGSAEEKSFNRADVFKRHLTSVHGVEQSPPNSRRRCHGSTARPANNRPTGATGRCSTCSTTFNNAQDFYEHLDDCVLRVVQQEEPSEAINHLHHHKIATDEAVKTSMQRELLNATEGARVSPPADELEVDHAIDRIGKRFAPTEEIEGSLPDDLQHQQFGSQASPWLALTKPSYPLSNTSLPPISGSAPLADRRRRKRNRYSSASEQMKMKNRALYVHDAHRRLGHDNMMRYQDSNVRMSLADRHPYGADLDADTMNRAHPNHDVLAWT